jgi:hypothetical protein
MSCEPIPTQRIAADVISGDSVTEIAQEEGMSRQYDSQRGTRPRVAELLRDAVFKFLKDLLK